MMKKLLDRLVIDRWRDMWKMWSIRLNAVLTALIGALGWMLATAPGTVLEVINSLPPEFRVLFPPFVSFALFGIIAIIRLWDQTKKKGSTDE